jgi:hypothetical protein
MQRLSIKCNSVKAWNQLVQLDKSQES